MNNQFIMKFRIGNKRKNRTIGFNNVIPDIIKEFKIEESFIIENIRSVWSEITGNIIATHSNPDRIFKTILFVTVDHSVFANELIMMKDSIIEKIKEKIAVDLITNIKVEIRKI